MQCESTRSHWYLEPVVVVRGARCRATAYNLKARMAFWCLLRGRGDYFFKPENVDKHQVLIRWRLKMSLLWGGRLSMLEMSLSTVSRKAFRPTLAALCGLSCPKGESSLQCHVWAIKVDRGPCLKMVQLWWCWECLENAWNCIIPLGAAMLVHWILSMVTACSGCLLILFMTLLWVLHV